jgi:capsule biosynthesis phosphatase
MPEKNKIIVLDIDGVLCEIKSEQQRYSELKPNDQIVKKITEYKDNGFYIILYSSRNMNTYDNNLGKINANTAKILLEWLDRHAVPFDEIYFGKPWCGFDGFYVDDKAIRPNEFLALSHDEIIKLLSKGTLDNGDI